MEVRRASSKRESDVPIVGYILRHGQAPPAGGPLPGQWRALVLLSKRGRAQAVSQSAHDQMFAGRVRDIPGLSPPIEMPAAGGRDGGRHRGRAEKESLYASSSSPHTNSASW